MEKKYDNDRTSACHHIDWATPTHWSTKRICTLLRYFMLDCGGRYFLVENAPLLAVVNALTIDQDTTRKVRMYLDAILAIVGGDSSLS